MSKEIYISSTPHETRLAIVEKEELTEIYYERENEYTLAGSIYKGRVTRVLPGMQSSFVDIGLERDAFLYITDFMEETDEAADFDAASGGEGRRARGDGSTAEGRGRARRDRDRDRERSGRESTSETRAGGRSAGSDANTEEYESVGSRSDEAAQGLEGEQPGEGLSQEPGVAGGEVGRRWRGRRGRRRGRSAAGEAQTGGPAPEDAGEEFDEVSAPQQESLEHSLYEARHSALRDDSDRDRAGRDAGGRDRGGRFERPDAARDRFAARGARHASAQEQRLDQQAVSHGGAQAEPFILPGESLSKYRRAEQKDAGAESAHEPASAARSADNRTQTKPSTQVEMLPGWDGGQVLPGESLSRLRDGQGAPGEERERDWGYAGREARPEGRGGRGLDRRRARDERHGRNSREEGGREYRAELRPMDPAEAVLPPVSSGHDVTESEYEPLSAGQTDLAPLEGLDTAAAHEAEFEEAISELHDAELLEAEDLPDPEFHETTMEYEPEENAAVSFRMDPSAAREFRHGGSVAEPQELVSPAPEGDAAAGLEVVAGQPPAERIAAQPPARQTSDGLPVPSTPEAASETSVSSLAAHSSAVPLEGDFAPGDGHLEEELLDEEDLELGSLRAGALEDESDEEVLENAADLGSMLRDMTIDDITGQGSRGLDEDEEGAFDDGDDFEEDEMESTLDDDGEEGGVSGSEISEVEEEEFAEISSYDENGTPEMPVSEEENLPAADGAEGAGEDQNGGGREGGRRGRRDGRRGGRDRVGRDRRGAPRLGGRERGGRASVQATNLPAISDLLKPGQEVLVQIAKEPIAKKGARITSHIALPGRFLVFMPTVNHTGVSRKIESDSERRRLKEILLSERGDAGGGFIVRTAAAGAGEEELRSDLRFLLNLWADIKARSESSKSPALIYHDLNLIERILRDQVTDNFSAIWVDTETEYERVLRFLQRFQPSLIRRVKLYTKETPLFEQFGITEEINAALRSKVWLKSGGSIVINQTEALVAIDINTGKYVGKTARLEDTIVKTNLDAIPEIVRQIRLRDLGGIIIIDFIDMDERKNRNRVMAALEEELKKDRAPSKVLQFNDFGLVAITRKRVKQSLERTLSTTCSVCAGTGMVKSPVTVCNDIYIEMRKMHKLIDKGDIMLRVHPETVKQLKSGGGKWLQEMEEMSGKTILVKSDPSLHPEQFDIH
ncbi:MAG: Rne/Rng family ribonuclease [Acidobacteriota bacterium]